MPKTTRRNARRMATQNFRQPQGQAIAFRPVHIHHFSTLPWRWGFMKTRYLLLPTICLLITVAALTAAQTPAPADPPAVLQIFREEIKQGKNALHETVEVGYVQAFTKAKWPTGYLGMTSVSGPNEAWFLVPFDSFAAFEKDRQGV